MIKNPSPPLLKQDKEKFVVPKEIQDCIFITEIHDRTHR